LKSFIIFTLMKKVVHILAGFPGYALLMAVAFFLFPWIFELELFGNNLRPGILIAAATVVFMCVFEKAWQKSGRKKGAYFLHALLESFFSAFITSLLITLPFYGGVIISGGYDSPKPMMSVWIAIPSISIITFLFMAIPLIIGNMGYRILLRLMDSRISVEGAD